jgi:hypothetical protein
VQASRHFYVAVLGVAMLGGPGAVLHNGIGCGDTWWPPCISTKQHWEQRCLVAIRYFDAMIWCVKTPSGH